LTLKGHVRDHHIRANLRDEVLVEARLTTEMVEVFHLNVRVASHKRSFVQGAATTLDEHMPPKHRAIKERTPEKVAELAALVGPATAEASKHLLAAGDHPEQGVRSCLGLLALKERYGQDRLEEACKRALDNGSGGIYSYKTVRNILDKNLDRGVLPRAGLRTAGHHENVRGEEYYAEAGARC
jgi:transposase